MTKKKRLLIVPILVLLFAGVLWFALSYVKVGLMSPLSPGKKVVLMQEVATATESARPYIVEPFVSELEIPWAFVFTSPERLLVTERVGRLRQVVDGKLAQDPLFTFSEISATGEEGLMGITLDPDYAKNKTFYVCLAYNNGTRLMTKVLRLFDENSRVRVDGILLDSVPAAQFHAGCGLKIGPDKKLYVSTGDALERQTAQDIQVFSGKILRINLDGSIPTDNPFPNSPVYTYGHRNAQGFDWHPVTKQMIATEHGPSLIDGPAGGDEINHIVSGANYGWPVVSHERSAEGMKSPLLVFTPAVAPASGMFYRSNVFPQFRNSFFFGMLKGEGIVQVTFSNNDGEKVESYMELDGLNVGRVRDVVEGPDGLLYFSTSNRDGRGVAQKGDDRIYRLQIKQ